MKNLIDREILLVWLNNMEIEHRYYAILAERAGDKLNEQNEIGRSVSFSQVLEHIAQMPSETPQESRDKRCGTCVNYPKKVDNTIHCKKGWSLSNPKCTSTMPVCETDGMGCPDWKAKETPICRWCKEPIYRRIDTWYHDESFNLQYCENDFNHIAQPLEERGLETEKPKEKRRVWECSMCGKDIEYCLSTSYYSHRENYSVLCETKGSRIDPSKRATPKPDSEKWINV